MVPRRSFHDERCRALSAVERVDRGESRAGREQRGRERAARHRCVGIEAAAARSRELLERVDVVEVVHPGERVAVDGVARRAHEGVAELRVLDPAPHRVETRRLFGVVAARVVAVLTAERRHHDLVHSSLTAVQGTCLLHCSLATSRDTRLAHARSRAAARSAAPTLALLASDAGRRGPSALVRASPVRHARVRARLRLRPGPCSLRTGNRDAPRAATSGTGVRRCHRLRRHERRTPRARPVSRPVGRGRVRREAGRCPRGRGVRVFRRRGAVRARHRRRLPPEPRASYESAIGRALSPQERVRCHRETELRVRALLVLVATQLEMAPRER